LFSPSTMRRYRWEGWGYIFYILLLSFPTSRSQLCRVPSSFPALSNSQVGTCTTERGSGYCLFWFIYFLRSRTGQTVYSIQEGEDCWMAKQVLFIFLFLSFFLFDFWVEFRLSWLELSRVGWYYIPRAAYVTQLWRTQRKWERNKMGTCNERWVCAPMYIWQLK
jgi:hypothetical protein